jgi:hypothetical protein
VSPAPDDSVGLAAIWMRHRAACQRLFLQGTVIHCGSVARCLTKRPALMYPVM